jgi:hypothetical protein
MKESLFQLKKKLVAHLKFYFRVLNRVFVKTTLTREEAFYVPIVINNRNRLTYLKNLVNWLQKNGYQNIYILDNDSTYAPLLQYYKETTAKVVYLKKNAGYKALWENDLFKEIKKGYYVYTDSDLAPTEICPADLLFALYTTLKQHKSYEKCGPSLKIDDLLDSYHRKKEVIEVESKYWIKQVDKDVYDAPIDTTFALYKPLAFGDAEECKAIRLAGAYTLKHMPWYENSANLDEEAKYYMETISTSSYWYNPR